MAQCKIQGWGPAEPLRCPKVISAGSTEMNYSARDIIVTSKGKTYLGYAIYVICR